MKFLRVEFDRRLKLEYHGSRITLDAGLLAYRELDNALRLSDLAGGALSDGRRGKNIRHLLTELFRQSVFGRLAGYNDVNDASRLAHDPAMRAIVDRQGLDRRAASTSQMGRFAVAAWRRAASRSFMRRIEMTQPETPGAHDAEKHLRGRSNRGVPIPHAEAIFAAIELALAVQSGQFAPADGSESRRPGERIVRSPLILAGFIFSDPAQHQSPETADGGGQLL